MSENPPRRRAGMFVLRIATCVLAVLFIYGAALHVFDPAEMRRAIEGFQFVPTGWALLGAYLIPWIELFSGLGILFRRFRAASAFLIFGLMVIFTIATLVAWARGIELNCGCFGHIGNIGSETPDDYRWLILRDAGLLILAGYVFYSSLMKKRC